MLRYCALPDAVFIAAPFPLQRRLCCFVCRHSRVSASLICVYFMYSLYTRSNYVKKGATNRGVRCVRVVDVFVGKVSEEKHTRTWREARRRGGLLRGAICSRRDHEAEVLMAVVSNARDRRYCCTWTGSHQAALSSEEEVVQRTTNDTGGVSPMKWCTSKPQPQPQPQPSQPLGGPCLAPTTAPTRATVCALIGAGVGCLAEAPTTSTENTCYTDNR